MARDDELRRVGRAVAARRGELGMTRQELAGAAGLDPKTIYNLESGTRWPIAETRVAVSAALGWKGDALTEIADGAEPPPVAPLPANRAAAGRRRLFPDMPREMRALVEPRIREIHARIAVAEAARPDSPLNGASLYPDSPLNAARWDTITAQGMMVLPDEGFSLPEAAELLAIMQLGDARQEFGGAAAGLPEGT